MSSGVLQSLSAELVTTQTCIIGGIRGQWRSRPSLLGTLTAAAAGGGEVLGVLYKLIVDS